LAVIVGSRTSKDAGPYLRERSSRGVGGWRSGRSGQKL